MKKGLFIIMVFCLLILAGCSYTQVDTPPTTSEAFNIIGQNPYYYGEFVLSDATADYINSHSELFSVASEAIPDVDTVEFSYKKFKKTGEQDEVGLVRLKNLYAVQAFEEDFLNGKVTYILACDDEYNFYTLYYLGTVEIYEDDTFTAYAVPCANSSFDNVSGGITNVIAMAASYFQ